MQTNSFDREVIRKFLDTKPSHAQAIWWIQEISNRAEAGFGSFSPPEFAPADSFLTQSTGTPAPGAVRLVRPGEDQHEKWDTSNKFVENALKWGRKHDINVAFDGQVVATRRGSCAFGRHKIEEGDDICKIEIFKEDGETRVFWGCRPCWQAIITDLDLDPEVSG